MELVVGRVGRPQGIRGEVTVEVRTDDPDSRFAPGSVLLTEPAERGPLTVAAMRPRSGGVVVAFDGVADRAGAEALRGTVLLVDAARLPAIEDPDEWYDHQLVGLAAVDEAGAALGTVAEVVHAPASDLLAVRDTDGREHLIPFIRDMVPTVDVCAGRVVITPPDGLFDLAEPAGAAGSADGPGSAGGSGSADGPGSAGGSGSADGPGSADED